MKRGLAVLARTGLTPSPWRKVHCPWEYPDLSTALRGLLSTGPATQAVNHSGRSRVTDTIADSIAPYRRHDGSYSLNNTCYYLNAATPENDTHHTTADGVCCQPAARGHKRARTYASALIGLDLDGDM